MLLQAYSSVQFRSIPYCTVLLLYTRHKTDVAVFSLRQVAAGRTRSWLTLSSWWSWAPPWSRPRPPARSERPTFQMRYSGDTSFRPSSHCLLQGNMWLILHTLTKWPKQSPPSSLNSPWPQARPLTKTTGRTRRRCDWRRATEAKGGGKKGDAWEIAARWVYASVTCKGEMKETGRGSERLMWNWDRARKEKSCFTEEVNLSLTPSWADRAKEDVQMA